MEKRNSKLNHRAAAGLGIVLIAVSVATKNYGLMGAGLVFFIIGLLKKKKAEQT